VHTEGLTYRGSSTHRTDRGSQPSRHTPWTVRNTDSHLHTLLEDTTGLVLETTITLDGIIGKEIRK